jgi:hypothetical protein
LVSLTALNHRRLPHSAGLDRASAAGGAGSGLADAYRRDGGSGGDLGPCGRTSGDIQRALTGGNKCLTTGLWVPWFFVFVLNGKKKRWKVVTNLSAG